MTNCKTINPEFATYTWETSWEHDELETRIQNTQSHYGWAREYVLAGVNELSDAVDIIDVLNGVGDGLEEAIRSMQATVYDGDFSEREFSKVDFRRMGEEWLKEEWEYLT